MTKLFVSDQLVYTIPVLSAISKIVLIHCNSHYEKHIKIIPYQRVFPYHLRLLENKVSPKIKGKEREY